MTTHLELVRLPELMKLGEGRSEIGVAVIDGPVALGHPDLAAAAIRELPGKSPAGCQLHESGACEHGTLVAGMLFARRGSAAPAISPGCTLFLRPIFGESAGGARPPTASPEELASAIVESVDAGARVINLSSALTSPSPRGEDRLELALNHAAQRGVIAVAAAGNHASVGSSVITRHRWVIPAAACDSRGWPLAGGNVGSSIGRNGLSAPGERITSLGTQSKSGTLGGTSAAAPFVTGTIALLWSLFPGATAARIRLAVTGTENRRRARIVPPLLNAWAAYQALASGRIA